MSEVEPIYRLSGSLKVKTGTHPIHIYLRLCIVRLVLLVLVRMGIIETKTPYIAHNKYTTNGQCINAKMRPVLHKPNVLCQK